MGVQINHGKKQFWGAKGQPIVKYRETQRWAVQKTTYPIAMLFGCRLGYAQSCIRWRSRSPIGTGNFEGKGRHMAEHRDALKWAVQKRLNRSTCRLAENSCGPKEPCIRRGFRSPMGRDNFKGGGAVCCKVQWLSAVSCAKTAEPIEMPFGIWIQVGPRIYVLDGGPDRPMRRRNFLGKHAQACPTTLCGELCKNWWLIDCVVVLHPIRHKIGYFGDVSQANLLAWYAKPNTTKAHIYLPKEMYNNIK